MFALYEIIAGLYGEKEAYLDYVYNDLVGFTGIKLSKNNINREKITNLLYKVPLSRLLSLLGFAYYRSK